MPQCVFIKINKEQITMPKKYLILCLLMAALLTACGGSSEADLAVCDAYQVLADTWPSNPDEVTEDDTAIEIWSAVSSAATALTEAAENADNEELREAALEVGDWADSYFEDNQDSAIGQGFIPFFMESLTPGGDIIAAQCEELGSPITY
ncbi:MAG: hypothetical protein PVF49_07125 [Anaerolineales bacterium]|jgi:hypothetical protein